MRLALLIVATLLAAIPALAHSWYPFACCGNIDCFPVACDQLVETVSGWLYIPTGSRSSVSRSSRARIGIVMCASGTAVIIARSARSSCRMYSSRPAWSACIGTTS
jgi:hypothetical protein